MVQALILTSQDLLNAFWASRGSGYQLRPFEMNDGRFAVSTNVLNDPRFSSISAILAGGSVEDITTAQYTGSLAAADAIYAPKINSKKMLPFAAAQWSLSAPASNRQRIELRSGDQGNSGDPVGVRHRCELISSGNRFSDGATLWNSWAFKIHQYGGLDVPGNFTICGQYHATDLVFGRTPPFSVNFDDGRLQIWTTSSAALDGGGDGVLQTRYLGAGQLSTGVWHYLVTKHIFGSSGTLQMWLDGSQIINLTSTPFGYYGDASPSVYWQYGLYGGDYDHPNIIAAGTEDEMREAVSIVEYANMEWGTTDLTDRILNPLAI